MTGSAAGPVRLILREPPHLPFIQGWPGIPPAGARQAATVQGAVEVRVAQPVKAKWVRVEIRKYEAVPTTTSVAKQAFQSSWEHIGKVHILWRAAEGKDWDMLNTADFRFVIPLPQEMPPTVELSKMSGIRYELVASVCYKGKGGLFRKDPSSVSSVSQTLRIVKYDLASAWPMFNQPDTRSATAAGGQVVLSLDRNCTAFGPGDRMVVTASLKSTLNQAFRVKSFEIMLVEVLTIFPPAPDNEGKKSKKVKPPAPPTVKRSSVANARTAIGDFLGPHSESKGNLDLVIPTDRSLLTVRAKEFQLEYELILDAMIEATPNKISVGGIPVTIGTFSKSSAQQAVKDIGYVEGLSLRPASPQMSATNLLAQPANNISHRITASAGASMSLLSAGETPYRPSSYQPQRNSPSPVTNKSPSPPASPQQPPGFAPRQEPFRRTSSATTATTVATDNYLADRSATLPNRKNSHSPGFNGNGRSPEPSRGQFDDSSLRHRPSQSESGHNSGTGGGHARSVSSQTNPGYGAWNSTRTENIMEDTRTPSRGSNNSALGAEADRRQQTSVSPGLPDIADESAPPGYAPPPPQPSTVTRKAVPTNYMSAADEKEEQRRRYEHAQRVVSSGHSTVQGSRAASPEAAPAPAGPIPYDELYSHNGGGSSRPATMAPAAATPPAKPQLSAAQEKDKMRKRYEQAQQAVAINQANYPDSPVEEDEFRVKAPAPLTELPPGFIPAMGTPPVVVAATSYMSPQIPAARGPDSRSNTPRATGSPAPGPAPSARSVSNSSQPAPYMSAAEEKEMMRRRYEQAQQAVARATSPTPPSSPPAMGGSSMSTQQIRAQSPPAAATPPRAATQPYLSAAEEKEMMRKRYEEATTRVARATSDSPSGSPAPASAPQAQPTQFTPLNTHIPSAPLSYDEIFGPDSNAASSSASRPVSQSPATYLSAAQEKEMMRQRYTEARTAVARATAGDLTPPAQSPKADAAPAEAPIPYDAIFGPGGTSSAPPAQPAPAPAPAPAPYLSAAEEKEMMRRRYEEAQGRVARTAAQEQNGTAASPTTATPSTPYMSAEEEKDMMRRRYEEASMSVRHASSPSRSATDFSPGGHGSQWGSMSGIMSPSRSMTSPDGPPPPLAPRPPREYIDRIAPGGR